MGTTRVRWCRRQNYYDQDAWRGTWAYDGGVFANQASHHVDLVQWCLGQPVTVYATGRTALAKDIETEDTGAAVVTFASGAIGVIEATTATRPVDLEGSLSILGENGTVVIGGFAANKLVDWKFETAEPGDEEVFAKFSDNPAERLWLRPYRLSAACRRCGDERRALPGRWPGGTALAGTRHRHL